MNQIRENLFKKRKSYSPGIPLHQQKTKETLQPLASKVVVYDFVESE